MTPTRPPQSADTATNASGLTIAEIVLGKEPPGPNKGKARKRALWAQAIAIAVVLHGGLWLSAVRKPPSLETWSAEVAARIHGLLEFRHVMEIAQPAAPVTPPLGPPAAPKRIALGQGGSAKAALKPAAAAQAGRLAASAKVVDLTSAAPIAEGRADSYAGGNTAASGRSSAPVYDTNVDPSAEARPGSPDTGRRQIALLDSEWRCPWPEAAQNTEALGNEQVVLLRVTVDENGRFQSGTLVSVPRLGTGTGDFGFGPAALKCASAARYAPATDDLGHPIKAVSPPIRVRFVR